MGSHKGMLCLFFCFILAILSSQASMNISNESTQWFLCSNYMSGVPCPPVYGAPNEEGIPMKGGIGEGVGQEEMGASMSQYPNVLRIYISYYNFYGGDSSGSLSYFDLYCNELDLNNPDTSSTWKAVIGLGNRYVGGGDWVLQANTDYYSGVDNSTLLFSTDGYGLASSFSSGMGSSYVWTGLDIYGAISYNNCNGWTDSSSSYNGEYGDSSSASISFFDSGSNYCDQQYYIYCAEQPDLSAPVLEWVAPSPVDWSVLRKNATLVLNAVDTSMLSSCDMYIDDVILPIYSSDLLVDLQMDNNTLILDNEYVTVDSSVYGRNGSCNGMAGGTCAYVSDGRFGGAMNFDGNSAYLSLAEVPVFGDFTISFWVNFYDFLPITYVDYQILFWSNNPTMYIRNNLYTKDNIEFATASSEYGWVGSGGRGSISLYPYRWYFVTVTHSSVVNKIYVDGVLDRSFAWAGTQLDDGSETYVGYGSSYSPYADIDEFRIYNSEFSQKDIDALYHSGFRFLNMSLVETVFNDSFVANRHVFQDYICDLHSNCGYSDVRSFDVLSPSIGFVSPSTPLEGSSVTPSFAVNVSASSSTSENISVLVDLDNKLTSWLRLNGNYSDDFGLAGLNYPSGHLLFEDGKFGEAAYFGGDAQVINYGAPASWDVENDSFTFSFWLKVASLKNDSGDGQLRPISIQNSSADKNLMFVSIPIVTPTKSSVQMYIEDKNHYTQVIGSSYNNISLGNWSMFTFVVDRKNDYTVSFVNGVPQAYSSLNLGLINFSRQWMSFGGRWDGEFPYNGSIDDFVFVRRALGVDEVRSLFDASANPYNHNFLNVSDGSHSLRGFVQDSVGSQNQTDVRSFSSLADLSFPYFSGENHSSNVSSESVADFWINVSDNSMNWDYVLFQSYIGGVWNNYLASYVLENNVTRRYFFNLSEGNFTNAGQLIQWKWQAYDTKGNWNETGMYSFYVVAYCGNGVCEGGYSESYDVCPADCLPLNQSLSVTACPDTDTGRSVLWIVVSLAVVFIIAGYALKRVIVGVFGSLAMFIISLFFYGCVWLIGLLMTLFGVLFLIMFAGAMLLPDWEL